MIAAQATPPAPDRVGAGRSRGPARARLHATRPERARPLRRRGRLHHAARDARRRAAARRRGGRAAHARAASRRSAARGAVFISLHHDAAGRRAPASATRSRARAENWYHGEGFGTPSPAPYPDSAPHRPADRWSRRPWSAARSTSPTRLASTFGAHPHAAPTAPAAPSAGSSRATGNRRMMRYYGFYRTRAGARVSWRPAPRRSTTPSCARIDRSPRRFDRHRSHLRARGLLRRRGGSSRYGRAAQQGPLSTVPPLTV